MFLTKKFHNNVAFLLGFLKIYLCYYLRYKNPFYITIQNYRVTTCIIHNDYNLK